MWRLSLTVLGLGLLMRNVDAGHTCIHCACMCMNGCVTYLGVCSCALLCEHIKEAVYPQLVPPIT